MGKLIYIPLACVALILSTRGFAAPAAKPGAKPAASPVAESPAGPDGKADSIIASRYVGNDLKNYVDALANQLAIRTRVVDPFCQPQDPNAKPVAKPTATKVVRRPVAEPPSPLSDIVSRIEITTVMPKDKRFLVGGRRIGEGDKVPIAYRNKLIHVEVVEVSSRRIVFRNTDTGETGIRKLNMMPAGMTQGSGKIAAPGMVPTNPNAPLEVDSPSSTPAGTGNP